MLILTAALMLAAQPAPMIQTFEDFCIADEYQVFYDENDVAHACPVEDDTSPLDDPRVSKQWAVDVCAERDRSEWRACMAEGLIEAPARQGTRR